MLFMGLFFISVVCALLAFDAVLRRQCRNHAEQWKQDGYPWGFFIFKRNSPFFAGCAARTRVLQQWTFSNPGWAGADGTTRRYLQYFRMAGAAALVFWLLAVLKIFNIL